MECSTNQRSSLAELFPMITLLETQGYSKFQLAAMEKGQRRFISQPWASHALLSQMFWGFTHTVDELSHTQPKRWVELKVSLSNVASLSMSVQLPVLKTQSYFCPSPTKYIANTHTLTHSHNPTQNRGSKCGWKRQTASLISSHPGLFVSTWSLPVISQLLSKLFNHAHVWNHLNTADTTPGKALSCTEPCADTLSENQTLGMNE